ncbi:MAG: AraC family transcriptional regulator [Novosphingobium sp.]|uniref:AraC family transcriptional regulator n=1 Tax=Novosphingobium sp. TaxID=1874826 RepID=UPI0032B85145
MQPGPENRNDSPPGAKAELVEACLREGAFSPHRHDTYTIALTTTGVQSFNYRGENRRSLPGQVMVLHPDEVHDGYCCDEAGFSYRAAYLPPGDVQTVLGGAPLPFLSNGVSADPALVTAALRFVEMCATDSEPLGYQDALQQLVSAMQGCAGQAQAKRTVNTRAVMRVRDFLDSVPDPGTGLDQLEAIAGYDRWQLSRDFRWLLGTSPYRYLQCRRIERARQLLRSGLPLAAAAHEAGFADQSHFGRIFKRTLGTTPLAWRQGERSRTIVL